MARDGFQIQRRVGQGQPAGSLKGKKAVLVKQVKEEPGTGLQKAAKQTAWINIVPPGDESIDAGGGVMDHTLEGDLQVVRLYIDVPRDVDLDLFVDGSVILHVDDGQGFHGEIDLGDFTGDSYMPMSKVQLVATNNGAAAQNVRAWLVVL